jgi:hypothetical protein
VSFPVAEIQFELPDSESGIQPEWSTILDLMVASPFPNTYASYTADAVVNESVLTSVSSVIIIYCYDTYAYETIRPRIEKR